MKQTEQKWLVLLHSLVELNGGDQRRKVLQYINDCNYWYKNDRNDTLLTTRNELAWRNDFSFERQHLVEQGYMKNNGQGKWKITQKGRNYLLSLTERAKSQTVGSQKYYTAAFFKKLVLEQNIIELEEDQILIEQLSQENDLSNEQHYILNNEPLPKGSTSNRSTNKYAYNRSPNVSRRALNRAGHLCEIDPNHSSFLRRDGITLYMEPHHLVPMKFTDFFGVNLDREQNIFSLCSNCHNQIHYGAKEDVQKLISRLFLSRKKEICSILGKDISLEELYQIYDIYNE